MKKILLSAIAACGFAGVGLAADTPARPQAADTQDLVFRAGDGLVRFRLHVQVDGKAPTAAWAGFIDRVFAFYDRNGDQALTADEAARMPHPGTFNQGINLIFNGRGGRGAVSFAQMDANKDGKLTAEELRAYVRTTGFGPLQVVVQPPQPTAQRLTDAFFKNVNRKGDGRLTKAELAAAWAAVARLDMDEDEIVTSQELLSQPANPYYAEQVVVDYGGMPPQRPQVQSPFVVLPRDGTPAQWAEAIVAHFERDTSAPLPFAGLRASENLPKFSRDQLRKAEVEFYVKWLERPADLELSVQLGSIAEGVGRVLALGGEPAGVRVAKAGRPQALEPAAKLGADGVLRVTLADALLEYNRAASSDPYSGTIQFYLQQLRTAAGDKKYVEKKDLMDNPQLQFFVNVFDDLDRNGDGKLTIAEIQAGFDLMSAGTKCQATVTVVPQGRSFFTLIDGNHDSRLSRRELVTAAKGFAAFDRNGDGAVERTELPQQFQVTASQGQNFGGQRFVSVFGMQQNTAAGPGKGPAWFRKMDRNRDGDVSAREFLGTPAEFQEIDADGDGLIAPPEAERYDAQRKAKVAAK